MKAKLIISVLLVISSLSFIFKSNETASRVVSAATSASNNITNEFLIGLMNCGIAPNFTYLDSLGINLWHRYFISEEYDPINNRYYPVGWNYNDRLLTDSTYVTAIQTQLTTINSHDSMKTLMQRPKIEWLCHGQRSDYECENMSHIDTNVWFYSFQSPVVLNQDHNILPLSLIHI